MGLYTYLLENFNYYNKPEGQDPVGKVVGLATYGIITGSLIGLTDATLKSHVLAVHKPVHLPSFLNVMGYWLVPFTGMAVAYSSITYMATNFRNKDDNLNQVLGALAAGGVLHAWQKDPMISGYGTALLVIVAVLKRQFKDSDLRTHNLIVPEKDVIQWGFSWRNLPYRDYNKGAERWPFDKEDYYANF